MISAGDLAPKPDDRLANLSARKQRAAIVRHEAREVPSRRVHVRLRITPDTLQFFATIFLRKLGYATAGAPPDHQAHCLQNGTITPAKHGSTPIETPCHREATPAMRSQQALRGCAPSLAPPRTAKTAGPAPHLASAIIFRRVAPFHFATMSKDLDEARSD